MAIKIEINRETLTDALNKQIASLKRSKTTNNNKLMHKIIDDDIKHITDAINTMSESK